VAPPTESFLGDSDLSVEDPAVTLRVLGSTVITALAACCWRLQVPATTPSTRRTGEIHPAGRDTRSTNPSGIVYARALVDAITYGSKAGSNKMS
jgi:hypothetical protein